MSIPCENLLRPLAIGSVTLKNRVIMAPMTRRRAAADHTPSDLMATYYAQRAGFGLILTEPTMVQRNYSGFGLDPAIVNKEQIAAWRTVTEGVHAKGGAIYLTLSHAGRATTPSHLSSRNLVVMGPSREGVPPPTTAANAAVLFPTKVHKMQRAEIQAVRDCFVRAAKNAMAAGFDGVEVDASSGYLLDQFLRNGCNNRNDEYGGSLANRARFLLEVVDAVMEAVGRDRVSVRLSPASAYNGMSDSDPVALLAHVARALDERRIAFLDLVCGGEATTRQDAVAKCGRANFSGPLVLGGGFSPVMAEEAIRRGAADAVAFATATVANPDYVDRVVAGAPLNQADERKLMVGGAAGYIDYPLWADEVARQSARASASRSASNSALASREASAVPMRPATITAASAPREHSVTSRRSSVSPAPTVVGSQTPAKKLLRPLVLHQLPCKNRMIMGPLPRQRADSDHVPTAAMVKYYADRSSMGLLVSEPVDIQPGYYTYIQGPCIFTRAQVEGWKKVTDAVHAKGGFIFCQLHHGGRAVAACNLEAHDYSADDKDSRERSLSLSEDPNEPAGNAAAPSPGNVISASTRPVPANIVCPAAFAKNGREQPYPQRVVAVRRPKSAWLVNLYASAARKAMAAGFDGVEVQAGNGFLIDQFLRDGCNDRADEYGGSVDKRCRLLTEVVDAVLKVVGKEKVGVRVSPTDPALGMKESNVPALCRAVAALLHQRDIAYLAIANDYALRAFNLMRPAFHKQPIIVDAPADTHATFGDCEDMLDDEKYRLKQPPPETTSDPEFADLAFPPKNHFAPDAVSFGLPMVANPDLADKAVYGVPFKKEIGELLFTHGDNGYNDYPTYREERRKARLAAVQCREDAAVEMEKQRQSLSISRDPSILRAEDSNTAGERWVNEQDATSVKPSVTWTRISQPRRASVSQPNAGNHTANIV